MIQLSRYFRIPFSDPAISLNELIAFATDNLQRLIANNPGAVFNNLINGTTTALATLSTCSTDDQTKLAIRKAAKLAKDTFRKALLENIRPVYGALLNKFNDPSPQMTTCFPLGRSIFQTETDDTLRNRLETLVNGLATLIPVMGSEAHGIASSLLSTWIGLYSASETASGTKTATQLEKNTARAILEKQLTINLLAVAQQHVGNEAMADTYFQQHLLEDPAAPEDPAPPPTP